MTWPNHGTWSAEKDQHRVTTEGGDRFTWVVDCGHLILPSGKLVACDPFAFLQTSNNPHVLVPPGRYPVSVTMADVSENLDRSHLREAYATVRFAPGEDAYRVALPLVGEGESREPLPGDSFIGFGVDAGTACFVDDEAVAKFMPPDTNWYETIFDNGRDDSWFAQMDDHNHIQFGLANITLPLAQNGENIIIIHSGWGDGMYPVIGSFDANDQLLAVHIDFFVVPRADS
jgi:Protein of unknown function (DUF4241)